MGFLRKYFGDPLVGLLALVAVSVVVALVCSALRQSSRERAYRKFVGSKRRGQKG